MLVKKKKKAWTFLTWLVYIAMLHCALSIIVYSDMSYQIASVKTQISVLQNLLNAGIFRLEVTEEDHVCFPHCQLKCSINKRTS